ncbi:hypothetical protein H5W18_06555 [Lactobacillus sp. Marseille-P7033]|nr:hypothetical protein [Lactobacillus sp. Marseille-P7033]NGC78329.1 hypothetical protein [Limosilactobacillus reuteri]
MEDKQSKLRESYNQLNYLHSKLENEVNSLGKELNKLKKEIDKDPNGSDDQVPEEVILEDDKELNDFLNEDMIFKAMNKYDKTYKDERIKSYIPLGIIAFALIISSIVLFFVYKHHLEKYEMVVSVSIISILLVSCGLRIWLSKKIKKGTSKNRISSVANELSNKVQEVLKRGKYNSEYLGYVLLERIQERERLNDQFSKIMHLINVTTKFSSLLVAMLALLITVFKDYSGIKFFFIVIIVVIFLGVLADYYNYKISDSYYYQRRTILDAITKYKFEKEKDKK